MAGRLLRRKIVNVCEAEFAKLDNWEIVEPDMLLCEIEINYTYPPDHFLASGTRWYGITVEDYLNWWYLEDVRRVMRYFRRFRRWGSSWKVVPKAHHPGNRSEKMHLLLCEMSCKDEEE